MPQRALPSPVNQPEHPAAGLVVGLAVVIAFPAVHPLHAHAGRVVVAVDAQNLLVALHGKVKAPRGIVSIGFRQKLGNLIPARRELGSDGFVHVVGLFQIGEKLDGRFESRAELWQENRFGDFFRIPVTPVPYEQIRIRDPRIGEFRHDRAALSRGSGPLRNLVQRIQVVDIRGFKVFVFERLIPFGHQLVRKKKLLLAADDFPVRKSDRILGGKSRSKKKGG